MTPIDCRLFALICSTALGCWWISMMLQPHPLGHCRLRDVPIAFVMVCFVGALCWPIVVALQCALRYDWSQFGNSDAFDENRVPTIEPEPRSGHPLAAFVGLRNALIAEVGVVTLLVIVVVIARVWGRQ